MPVVEWVGEAGEGEVMPRLWEGDSVRAEVMVAMANRLPDSGERPCHVDCPRDTGC